MKKAQGRPTKWTPEMNKKILEYFDIEPSYEAEVVYTNKRGEECTRFETKPNPMPTFEGFAASIEVDDDTLSNWAKEENKEKYPGFFGAYKRSKQLQHNLLVTNGLLGLYSTPFAIFTAKNVTGMRDVQENRLVDKKGNDLISSEDVAERVANLIKAK